MEIVRASKQPMTITFEPNELQILAEIAGRIGGSREKTYREFTDKLQNELLSNGYKWTDDARIEGHIIFQ